MREGEETWGVPNSSAVHAEKVDDMLVKGDTGGRRILVAGYLCRPINTAVVVAYTPNNKCRVGWVGDSRPHRNSIERNHGMKCSV